LKLLAETRQTGTLWFDALFPNRSVADDFDVMHRRIDRFQSSVRIGETRVSETYTAFRHGQDEETIDVIDWFKEHPVPIDAFLADRFTPESQTNRLLAVIRCGWDERIAVQDLFGESYTLPSMQDIREACTGLGLHASALFLQDFDRDFLLPFDGGYGLVVLYVTRWQDDLFEEAGFRALAGDSLGEQRAVVSAEQLDQPRSYDALFSAELPELQDPAPRDWQAWKAERDWDPGALDWNAGTRRGDGMIIPVAALDNLEISVKLARTLLVDDPDTPWLSAEGMVNAATVLHRHAPLESVYAVFLALDRAREAPRQVGYICQLFRQQTVGAFSEIFIRDLEDAETLSFQDACRHLCAALLEAGWLEGAENQANARTAVQHAIKDDPARLEIALASLAAAVA
ncbi:MAG: hypothetical protein O2985_01705, partial [Proteobacteria bacterium]|nr:hypothetical protein [Pseudomonadota bacterium]